MSKKQSWNPKEKQRKIIPTVTKNELCKDLLIIRGKSKVWEFFLSANKATVWLFSNFSEISTLEEIIRCPSSKFMSIFST